ncbi:MAG: hypothetical protein MZV64_63310 [Ignavibacteriales bacterium]|nr:hypothetical protein [Ignavibacteriales bacterium]
MFWRRVRCTDRREESRQRAEVTPEDPGGDALCRAVALRAFRRSDILGADHERFPDLRIPRPRPRRRPHAAARSGPCRSIPTSPWITSAAGAWPPASSTTPSIRPATPSAPATPSSSPPRRSSAPTPRPPAAATWSSNRR